MPLRFAPTRLVDYPWVVVRIACRFCGRAGRYRLARLAARYGPEQDLAGLLRDLASTCPWYNERARKYEPRCGAFYVDLEHDLPPADLPDAAILRRRTPAREDLPKPKGTDRSPTGAPGTGPMLSGWASPEIGTRCQRCPRRLRFGKAELLERFGDRRLTDLLLLITADCDRHGNTQVYELCGAMFDLSDSSDEPRGVA